MRVVFGNITLWMRAHLRLKITVIVDKPFRAFPAILSNSGNAQHVLLLTHCDSSATNGVSPLLWPFTMSSLECPLQLSTPPISACVALAWKTTPLMIVATFGMKRVSTVFTISISEQALPLLTMLARHSQEIKTAIFDIWVVTDKDSMWKFLLLPLSTCVHVNGSRGNSLVEFR